MNSCKLYPEKGIKLFKELQKVYGRNTAIDIYSYVSQKDFVDTMENPNLDEEGFPSIEDIEKNDFLKQIINTTILKNQDSQLLREVEDTYDNFNMLLEEATNYNKNNNPFIAIVDQTDTGLKINLYKKTPETQQKWVDQKSSQNLRNKLISIFQPIGLTPSFLSQMEVKAGRIGVTEFSVVTETANNFASMIRIANNKEGAEALNEEFAHTLVAMFKNSPLIERSLKALKNSPEAIKEILGDEFDDNMEYHDQDMDKMAEEALGQILRDAMIDQMMGRSDNLTSLFERTVNHIRDKFKDFDDNEIVQAVVSSMESMKEIAEQVLSKEAMAINEAMMSPLFKRNDSFNSLSDRISREMQILKDIKETEALRYKILGKDNGVTSKALIAMLDKHEVLGTPLEGIFTYLQTAVNDLKEIETSFNSIQTSDSLDSIVGTKSNPKKLSTFLRQSRSHIMSYKNTIEKLRKEIIKQQQEYNELLNSGAATGKDEEWIQKIKLAGSTYEDFVTILKDLQDLEKNLEDKYKELSFPLVKSYLIPFVKGLGQIKDSEGNIITMEDILTKTDRDISFFDKWLDCMAESSNTLLQSFDAVYKHAMWESRQKTVSDIYEIQNLMRQAKNDGLNDLSWMFEKDNERNKTGNYISKFNWGQYFKDKLEFRQKMIDKYGENPSGKELAAKKAEVKNWYDTHTQKEGKRTIPANIYLNKEFSKLMADSKYKSFYDAFMSLKSKMDKRYGLPPATVRAIQDRKDGTQRIIDMASEPSKLIDNIKEGLKNTFCRTEDDDQDFGIKSLVDFEGNEYNTLPQQYKNRLKNPNELSDDLFGSLVKYSYSTNRFEQLDNVIDALEIAHDVVQDLEVGDSKGDLAVKAIFDVLGVKVNKQIIKKGKSNLHDKLDKWFKRELYQKYIEDEGNIEGTGLDKAKTANFFMGLASKGFMGFNFMSGLVNIASAMTLQRVEALTGEYFTNKQLAKADGAYFKALFNKCSEITNNIKTNKLDLVAMACNVKNEFDSIVDQKRDAKLLKRMLGENYSMLPQTSGDHWLYFRTFIAKCQGQKVFVDGKEMNLWDALDPIDSPDGKGNKIVDLERIKNADGSTFDMESFSNECAALNRYLFGCYNKEDSNAASMVITGRAIQQLRKWWKPAMNGRFQKKQYSNELDKFVEGTYRTLIRTCITAFKNKHLLHTEYQELDDWEKANFRRALWELSVFALLWFAARADWGNDDDSPAAVRLAKLTMIKTSRDLSGMVPNTNFLTENLNVIRTPAVCLSYVDGLVNLAKTSLEFDSYFTEIESGGFKGYTVWEKSLMQAKLPILSWQKQFDRVTDLEELDKAINIFSKNQ